MPGLEISEVDFDCLPNQLHSDREMIGLFFFALCDYDSESLLNHIIINSIR